jgi:hypothetical protein
VGLPFYRHAGKKVLAAGSTTRRLLILREGAVAAVKEGVDIATVTEPGAKSVKCLRCWISRIRRTYVH